MRRLAFLAPLGAVLALAGSAMAQTPTVSVTLGEDLQREAAKLGDAEVREQADRLAEVVSGVLDRRDALEGSRIHLVLTDLKPNRPTYRQAMDRPGLDAINSISIGGATIEGEIVTADGRRIPVRYDWYSHNLSDVRGYSTWQDADRAFARLADNLAEGRYVSR